MVVEGAFGGFVEFLRIEGFVGGGGFVLWWIRCWLDHKCYPVIMEPTPFRLHFERGGSCA